MKKYLETLKNSILRKKNIIDHEVKYYKNIPLPSWNFVLNLMRA